METDVARQVEDDVDRSLDQGLEPEHRHAGVIGGRRARSHPAPGGRAGWIPGRRAWPAPDPEADRPRTAAARRRPRPGCGPAPWRSSGTRIVSSASHAIDQMRGDRQTDENGRRPVARATRRTASPSGISSGPRTATVESASAHHPALPPGGSVRRRRRRPAGRSIPQADQTEDRERVEGVAQVVEHVVAASIDDAGLEDRVGQARGTDEFFGRPLRAVVGRRPVRAGAQEAQHHDPRDARGPYRLDDRGRATDVDRLVRLGAELSIDARAVDDRLAIPERGGQFGRAGRVQPEPGPARDDHGLVARGPKPDVEMRAHEAGPAGDRDPHQANSSRGARGASGGIDASAATDTAPIPNTAASAAPRIVIAPPSQPVAEFGRLEAEFDLAASAAGVGAGGDRDRRVDRRAVGAGPGDPARRFRQRERSHPRREAEGDDEHAADHRPPWRLRRRAALRRATSSSNAGTRNGSETPANETNDCARHRTPAAIRIRCDRRSAPMLR